MFCFYERTFSHLSHSSSNLQCQTAFHMCPGHPPAGTAQIICRLAAPVSCVYIHVCAPLQAGGVWVQEEMMHIPYPAPQQHQESLEEVLTTTGVSLSFWRVLFNHTATLSIATLEAGGHTHACPNNKCWRRTV